MGFIIPSSRNRNYLSGSDWIINALDYILKAETCAGNMSQVVIMMDAPVDDSLLQKRLDEFIERFPVVHGSTSRDYINLAPYWRIPREPGQKVKINVIPMDVSSSFNDTVLLLEKCVNKPFKSDNEHLAFHYVQREDGKSCLAMTFDHRLLDARGAEMFLNMFQEYLSAGDVKGIHEGFDFAAPAHLSKWVEKFIAGRNVNRKIVALSGTSPGALPLPSQKDREYKFRILSFDPEESAEINSTAASEAGYLMEMPYLLSVITQAVHQLFRARGISPESYLIPVSMDMRSSEDIKKELFFNHVSYLFFQVQAEQSGDLKYLIHTVKQQMYEQVKSGLPGDIQQACLLTRIAPLPVLNKIFKIPFDGKIASFCFSHVGKSSFMFSELMESKISNIFHMPRVPAPPGLGFFFNHFNDRLNLVISYLDGLLEEEEVRMLETGLKEKLGLG